MSTPHIAGRQLAFFDGITKAFHRAQRRSAAPLKPPYGAIGPQHKRRIVPGAEVNQRAADKIQHSGKDGDEHHVRAHAGHVVAGGGDPRVGLREHPVQRLAVAERRGAQHFLAHRHEQRGWNTLAGYVGNHERQPFRVEHEEIV